MSALFRFFSLRYLRSHKLRTLLGFVSIVLGVSLFVSVDVANHGVLTAIEGSLETIAGKAEWHVTRGGSFGVDEALVGKLREHPGAIVAPVAQKPLTVLGLRSRALLTLGVDMKSDAMMRLYRPREAPDLATLARTILTKDPIIVTSAFAARHGLERGDTLEVNTPSGRRRLEITGLLDDVGPAKVFDGHFAIMPLTAMQRLYGREGRADRIEVAGMTRAEVEAACPGHTVTPSVRLSGSARDALTRLQSLFSISVIAILVGMFIIYNTVAISVVERVKVIGTLRAIGASRGRILRLLLAEWAVIGVLGAVAGVGCGYLFARVMVDATADVMNALFDIVDVGEIGLRPATAVAALVIGLGATLVAALVPALQAMRVSPIEILRPHSYRLGRGRRGIFVTGLACLAVGGSAGWVLSEHGTVGLALIGFVFVGIALVLPTITVWAAVRIRPWLRRLLHIEGFLGADNVAKFPQRTALTVTALGGALAMMVASASLVEGFSTGTRDWMEQALPFDLAVSANDFRANIYGHDVLPADAQERVAAVEGVELTYGVRFAFTDVHDQDVLVIAIDVAGFCEARRRAGMSSWAPELLDEDVRASIDAGRGVLVSRNFARKYGYDTGDTFTLPTPSGRRQMRVEGTVVEYSWPGGTVFMERARYREWWGDHTYNYVDLDVAEGHTVEQVRERLGETLPAHFVAHVFSSDEMKRIADDTLRQTVALADMQVLIALIIGFLGIVNTLLISVLQRKREIGLLRAVGMARGQVGRTVLVESLLIAVVGAAVGIACGLLGGWGPLRLFTVGTTGYLFPLVVPWRHLAFAIVASLAIGFLASLIPARRAASTNVLESIGYE